MLTLKPFHFLLGVLKQQSPNIRKPETWIAEIETLPSIQGKRTLLIPSLMHKLNSRQIPASHIYALLIPVKCHGTSSGLLPIGADLGTPKGVRNDNS